MKYLLWTDEKSGVPEYVTGATHRHHGKEIPNLTREKEMAKLYSQYSSAIQALDALERKTGLAFNIEKNETEEADTGDILFYRRDDEREENNSILK
jgi:hypothetical protein